MTVAVAGGDLEEATRRSTAIVDPFWGPISAARVHLARGDRVAAAECLLDAPPRCLRHAVVAGLLRARAATPPDEVIAHVTLAVELASAHGMLQTVVSEGRELMDVIERAAWRVPDEWLHRLRLAMAPATLAVRPTTRDLPEALTDRELDVLRLLPSRLTLSEVAKELYLSVNTVKFHLRVIYRKLGVNSRGDAAGIARAMTTTDSVAGR